MMASSSGPLRGNTPAPLSALRAAVDGQAFNLKKEIHMIARTPDLPIVPKMISAIVDFVEGD